MKRLFSASTSRSHHNSVRLACVRHAASVHPEPGSNSHVKMVFVSCQFYLALFTVNSGSFSIFRSICLFLNLAIHFSENLGIFRVALLFICQRSVILLLLLFLAATLISYHDRFRLSTTFLIFSNLFSNRKTFVSAVDFHTTILFPALSTTFYIYFSKHLQWHKRRKKRNLNLLRFFSYFLLVVNGERGI